MKKIWFFVIMLCPFILNSAAVKLIEKIEISQKKVMLQIPFSFCVTLEGDIIVVDGKAGDIKLYDSGGFFLRRLANRGGGPGEVKKPTFCDYNYPYFVVMDFQKNKVYRYLQKSRGEFRLINSFFCMGSGFDLKIWDDMVLISGYKYRTSKQAYALFSQNMLSEKVNFIIPVEKKFGYSTFPEYVQRNRNSFKIPIIGFLGFCDWQKNSTYFVWEGNLNIFKTDIDTFKMDVFGERSVCYKQPYISKKMILGYKKRDKRLIAKERHRMSVINGLFACKDFVGLLYGNYFRKLEGWKIMLQIYRPDGVFLRELILPDVLVTSAYKPAPTYFFEKKKCLLYYMYHQIDKDLNDRYTIAVYKIIK